MNSFAHLALFLLNRLVYAVLAFVVITFTVYLVLTVIAPTVLALPDLAGEGLPDLPAEGQTGSADEALADAVTAQLESLEFPSYPVWLSQSLSGDFGTSLRTRQPVGEIVAERSAATMELLTAALIPSLLFGVIIGVILALLRFWLTDFFLRPLAWLATATPIFWLGIMLIYYFAFQSRAFPASGRCGIGGECTPEDLITHLALPGTTLMMVWGSAIALYTRANILAVMHREARGRLHWRPFLESMLRFTPLAVPTLITGMLGSIILVETVFAWPGLGRLAIDGAMNLDPGVMLGVIFRMILWVFGAYLVFTLIYAIIGALFGSRAQGQTITALPLMYTVAEQQRYPLPQTPINTAPHYRGRRVIGILFTLLSIVALVVVVGILAASFAPSLLTDFDPVEADITNRLAPPGTDGHVLGTDDRGRDLAARLLVGGRVTFFNVFPATIIALVIAFVLGAIGGAVDGVAGSILNTPINWVSVTINLVPLLPLLILIAAVVGPGNLSLGLVLGLLGWTNLVPLVRARIRAARRYYTQRPSNEPVNVFDEADPVETQVGQQPVWQDSGTRIFGDLVLIAIYGVAINLAAFLIIDASLGFLGLGVQPPTPSWGGMLANAGQFLRQSPDLVVIPGLVLTIMVFCLTIIAERIRDTFTFLTEA